MRKKWILTSFLAVIMLPIIVMAAVLIFLASADLTQHREFIADSISKVAGRRLSLNGELELNLSMTPSIVVTDIALANAPWSSEPEMLTVDRIAASIELSPLLRGDIHIPTFHLQGVKSLLETSTDGNTNWVLSESTEDDVDAYDVDADDTATSGELNLPWIGELSINDVSFDYNDAQTGKQISAKLNHARLGAADPLSPTIIDIAGQVDNRPVEINGQLVLPSVFATDSVDVPIELQVKALGLEAKATGTITGSAQAPAIELALHASAADLKQLRQLFGDVVPQVKSVELDMTVKADQGQPVLFKLNAAAGKAKLVTELTILRQAAAPDVSGKVELKDIDVVALWAPLLNEKPASKTALTKTPASAKKSAQKTSAQKFDQVIALGWLQAFDANVLLSAKNINLPQAKIKSLQSRFIVEQRSLKISELELVTDAGTVTAGLILDAEAKQPAVSLDLNTTTLALAKLQPLAANKRFANSHAEAAISLTAKGDTVTKLIESLQGSVQLDYNDKKRKEKLAVNLQRIAKAKASGAPQLLLNADGLIEGEAIELSGSITPPTGLLVSHKPYQVDLVLQAFGVSGKIVGEVADPLTLNGLDLAIEAQAADLKGLRRAFGEAVPALGKVDLSASLTSEKSKIQLSNLAVVLEHGRADGELVLDTAKAVPDVQADLTLTDINLDKLLPALEKPASKKSAAKKSPANKPAKDKIFSDEPLPFEYLSQANVRMTLRVINLIENNKTLDEAEIKMNLQKGKLSASLVKHSAFHGGLDSDFVIDSSGKGVPTVKIKLKAPRLELGELAVVSGGSSAVEGPLAIDISLQGQGNSLAQIMATLNGDFYLLMEKGSADAKAIDLLVGGITAVLGTIFVEESSKTQINCAICDLKFDDGILTPQLVVLDTQYSTVLAAGQVDLKNEQLDIKVTPQAKGVTLSIAYPVHLYGQLQNPGIEIEKTDALLKTGELWANIVYPPSALIKFSDLAGGRNNPCVSMVAEKAGIPILGDIGKAAGGVVKGAGGVVEGTVKGVGGAVEGTVEGVGDAVGGAVKGIGSGIGKIFGIDKEADSKEKDSEVPAEIVDDDDVFGMDD